ncbi:MAG: hypothetical protein U0822_17605 [Anaerolineae bacterium]
MFPDAASPPTKIMIIRHAEKPPDSGKPHGVLFDGDMDVESLTVRGWQRAGALVQLFAPANGVFADTQLAMPSYLYAAPSAKHGHSRRPEQTISALSEELGTTIDLRFEKGQEQDLAADVMGRPGIVLICWEHEHIPDIVRSILPDASAAPDQWPDDRYDLVWVLDLDNATGQYTFAETQQQLLAGDLPRRLG